MVASPPPEEFESTRSGGDLRQAARAARRGSAARSGAGAPDSRFRGRLRRRDRRQDLLFVGVAGLWVLLDQLTKVIVRNSLAVGEHWELAEFFRFSHITNDGAAFGLFGGGGAWLAILPLIAIVAIAVYYLIPPIDHWLTRLGLALILGGAIGNWLDRLYQGEVTDFVNFNEFPAFNVADIGINVGIAIILIYLVVTDAKRAPLHR